MAVPSLKSFTYIDVAVRSYRSNPNPFELIFQCESEDDLPNEAMASLALTILDNEPRLVPKLLEGLWTDLNGRGPDSGMWWHGDPSTAFEQFDELQLPIPKSPAELRAILEPTNLTIRRDLSSPPKKWVGEFNFHAAFDVEHGVGLLTDGVDVLGLLRTFTSYFMDRSPQASH